MTSSWTYSLASSTWMARNSTRICGFFRVFVGTFSLSLLFYWMLAQHLLTMKKTVTMDWRTWFEDFTKEKTLEEWLGSWALTVTFLHLKGMQDKMKNPIFWWTACFRLRRRKSTSTLWLISLTRTSKVQQDSCMFFQAPGQPIVTSPWSSRKNTSKTFYKKVTLLQSWTQKWSKVTRPKTCTWQKTESSVWAFTVNPNLLTHWCTFLTESHTQIRWKTTRLYSDRGADGLTAVCSPFFTFGEITTLTYWNPTTTGSEVTSQSTFPWSWLACLLWTLSSPPRSTFLFFTSPFTKLTIKARFALILR